MDVVGDMAAYLPVDVCVLHSLERHCVCVYCTVQRGTVCVLHSLERHCVCTAQSREVLCVYCTFYRAYLD